MRRLATLLVVGLALLVVSSSVGSAATNDRPINIDDFEDGDTQTITDGEWSGWTGDMGTTTNAINGDYSGQLVSSSGSTSSTDVTRSSARQATELTFNLDVDGPDADIDLYGPSGRAFAVNFEDSGGLTVIGNGGSFDADARPNSVTTLEFRNIDYANNRADIYLDGVLQEENLNFETNISGINRLSISASDGTTVRVDNVQTDASIPASNPDADPTSAQPEGDLTTDPSDISIGVTDGDFPYDEVTVTGYLDGSQIGQQTLTSNGTASIPINQGLAGGSHSYYFELVDDYGNSITTQTFSFSVPDKLEIRNESNPSNLIDTTTATVTVFAGSGEQVDVYERSTTNGLLNLTGVPADKPLVISADASGYNPRRIFVSSLYDKPNLYLLPESKQATTTTFIISDYTGDFPRDQSVLEVERSINGEYQTVLGDYFGANGEFQGILRYNKRHRLVLRNTETGQSKVLGSFTPISSGEETVDVFASGEIDVQRTNALVSVSPSTSAVPAIGGQTITTTVRDRGAGVQSATVEIYREGSNGQLTLLADGSLSGPGELSRDVNLTGYGSDTLVVKTTFTTNDGQTSTLYENLSIREQMNNQYSLLSTLTSMSGLIPGGGLEAFQNAVAILTSIIAAAGAASTVRMSGEGFALIAVGVLAGWAVIGWVGYGLVFATGVGTGALVFFRRGV